MNEKITTQFTKLYIRSKISDVAADELDRFVEQNPQFRAILARLNDPDRLRSDIDLYSSIRRPSMKRVPLVKRLYARIAIVAAIIVVLTGSLMITMLADRDSNYSTDQWSAIVPGESRAYLTVSPHETIDLTDTQSAKESLTSGHITDQTISYLEDAAPSVEPVEHTLYVPRGGEYTLILSDGTKVMLNSDSKITYATAFTGDQRIVRLSGEAYFEVAHNPNKPFIVNVNDMMVEVLGTSFNINAYAANSIQTVLVDGSIKMCSRTNNRASATLKPHQLATFDLNDGGITVEEVDIEPYISWTSNYFVFRDQPITTIMETLARWYDIDFVINSDVGDVRLTGDLRRYDKIESLLTLFEQISDVRFRVDNRTITVYRQ